MDLSSIPTSTPIVSAAFYLGYEASANPEATFPESSTVGVATLDELLEPGDSWSDLSPGGYAGIETTFGPPDGVSEGPEENVHERHRADVTASVRHWLDTANGANAGFQVTLEPEGSGQVFNPTLVIEYTGRALPPPIPVEQTWGCSCEFGHGPDRVVHEGDPINTADGGLIESEVDLSVAAQGVPVNLRRTYNGSGHHRRADGSGLDPRLRDVSVRGRREWRCRVPGPDRWPGELRQADRRLLPGRHRRHRDAGRCHWWWLDPHEPRAGAAHVQRRWTTDLGSRRRRHRSHPRLHRHRNRDPGRDSDRRERQRDLDELRRRRSSTASSSRSPPTTAATWTTATPRSTAPHG